MSKSIFIKLVIPVFLILLMFDSNAQENTTFIKTNKYGTLLEDLHQMMIESPLYRKSNVGGRERQEFVFWIRDHVHVMKALRYWEEDLTSFLEYSLETQTPTGMYYDYYYPIERDLNWRMNVFDKKYWKIVSPEAIQLHRLPVTADVEYLVVEGAYYVWQSTGDKEWIKKWLPNLEKGIMYCMTDPIRWSTEHQLIKRAYTLDTWDFQQLPVPVDQLDAHGYDSQEVTFNVHEHTPKGILHGDNSGLYAACVQLSEMHAALGNKVDAKVWKNYAEITRLRTNQLCWNGRFYKHMFVEDDPPSYNTMDQEFTLGISNPYTVNRGVPTEEMAQSVVQEYLNLKESTKDESFAEWFGVYPSIEPYFGSSKPGEYLNGGVVTVVAGELAKAAFNHGYEEYGVDILNRLIDLTEKFDGYLPCVIQPDGKKSHGIPDNWGQAAIASAIVEGLAGVVDNSAVLGNITLSPRWAATGVKETEVKVKYGPSNEMVYYSYKKNVNSIQLKISSDAKEMALRILLPKGITNAKAGIDGKEAKIKIENIRDSYYAVFPYYEKSNFSVELSW